MKITTGAIACALLAACAPAAARLTAIAVTAVEPFAPGTHFGASRTPRLADGTLTSVGRLKFPAIPGVQVPTRMHASTHANYLAKYQAAVQKLVDDRLLLREDGEAHMARARSDEVAKLFSAPVVGQAPAQ